MNTTLVANPRLELGLHVRVRVRSLGLHVRVRSLVLLYFCRVWVRKYIFICMNAFICCYSRVFLFRNIVFSWNSWLFLNRNLVFIEYQGF